MGDWSSERKWNGTNYNVYRVPTWLTLVSQVEYIYRRVPFVLESGPSSILLRDGDRIKFGVGTDGSRFSGPLPLLCNLQLAVARVLKMSGAAEVIAQLMEDADDSDFPRTFLSSNDFCDILDAKLLLKGICA
jgi:hypothetical protein